MSPSLEAAQRIRAGQPAALAIHIVARQAGISTAAVAAGMRRHRTARPRPAPANLENAWWNR